MGPVAIVADVHERPSGIRETLESFGAKVEEAQLHAGDYALANVLVERKSVGDLHAAVENGTLWRQIGKLRHAGPIPFLLVEGEKLDRGPIPPSAIRGVCLAAIELGIRLIRTESRDDSALWLYRLAVRRSERWKRDRPAYAQRRRPHGSDQAAEAMLAAVPGISTESARALLARFGSVANVLAADEDEWLKIPGIGPKRAKALQRPSPNATPTRPRRQGAVIRSRRVRGDYGIDGG